MVRLTKGYEFNLAKSGFLFLRDKTYYLSFLLLITMGIFLWIASKDTLANAVFATVLVVFSSIVALYMTEFLFRIYLSQNQQARTFRVDNQAARNLDFKGKEFVYSTMVEPEI